MPEAREQRQRIKRKIGMNSAPVLPGGALRLRTMILIRWLAVMGQLVTLLLVYFGLGFKLPFVECLVVVSASAILNGIQMVSRPQTAWIQDREATVSLAFDMVQLTVLLALTGGLYNPFALLVLAPVTVSASVLGQKSTMVISGLTLIRITVLALFYYPLQLGTELELVTELTLTPLYLYGLWGALIVGTVFIAVYVSSLTREAHTMRSALQATQDALSREQRLSALGGLAAAAAHELGTPLGTLYVVAKDMQEQLEPDQTEMKEDLDLMLSEVMRCRDILRDMAAWKEIDGGEPYNVLPFLSMVEEAVSPYEKSSVAIEYNSRSEDGSVTPAVVRSPEMLHALGLLSQNAIQFARDKVVLDLHWDDEQVLLRIQDNGPGFPASVLSRLGDPYLSNRKAEENLSENQTDLREEKDGEHMGLGVFIATTLLGRTGAELEFDNAPNGGAVVSISWQRKRLEYQPVLSES